MDSLGCYQHTHCCSVMLSRKTIKNTISKLEKPFKQGPIKCPVYLRLPYLGKEAVALENYVKNIVNSTFKSVRFKISHFTRKPLNGI